MHLKVDSGLLGQGLATAAIVARGIDNGRISPELLAYRRGVGRRLAAHWKNRSVSTHPAIREYHRLHSLYGVENEPPSPEKLVTYVRRNQDFTSTGALVDCYNMVSARTLLSIGAHDLAKYSPPITLRVCDSQDEFVPLGQTERQSVAGEYGYVDANRRVICRLEVLQGEFSKTSRDSQDVAFFLQGNACLSAGVLLKGAWLLAELLERFTGAGAELVAFYDAGVSRTTTPGRPQVTFDDFRGLQLSIGTVAAVEPLAAQPALSAVRLAGGGTALAPSSALTAAADAPDVIGGRVVVAGGLHPLRIAGATFDTYLLTASAAEGARALMVEAPLPDGATLR